MARNVGEGALARIKSLSRETGIDVMALVRRYAQERLVYRLSVSEEARNFCLKGGLLLSIYNGGDLLRPTEDVDFNGVEGIGDVTRLDEAIRTALSTPVADDGVVFRLDTMRVAKDRTGIVPGGKVILLASVGSARTEVRVDVGFGNPVTPDARVIEVPSILPNVAPRPVISAYPLETVVAEKLHAMAQFGLFNTRIKDYYDVWMLLRLHPFSGEQLANAISRTFAHQNRPLPETMDGLSPAFVERNETAWRKFLRQVAPSLDVSLAQAAADIEGFIHPVMDRLRSDAREPGDWHPARGWGRGAP